jgi:anti-sigma-K factor RskA
MPSEPTLNLEDEADLMDAYVAGLLDDRQRQQFEQKMARDAGLRRKVDEARSTANLVSDAYRFVTPGAHFESALTTRITQMVPDMEDLPLVDSEPQVSARNKMILGVAIAVVVVMAVVAAVLIFS